MVGLCNDNEATATEAIPPSRPSTSPKAYGVHLDITAHAREG